MLCHSGDTMGSCACAMLAQRPAAWDIGLLSGSGRTTAAAAGGSELTGLLLPRSLQHSPPALCQGPRATVPCPSALSTCPLSPNGPGRCLLGGHQAAEGGTWLLLSLMDALTQSSGAGQVTRVCTPSLGPPRSPGVSLVLQGGESPSGDPALAACDRHLAIAIVVTPVGSSLQLGSTALPRADGAENACWLAEHARDVAPLNGTGWRPWHTTSEGERGQRNGSWASGE